MFPNRYKDADKKPDYVLYLNKDKESTPASQDQPKSNTEDNSKKDEIPDSLV